MFDINLPDNRQRATLFGMEFGAKEGKAGGGTAAVVIWEGSERLVDQWFYGRVWRHFDDVPLNSQQQIAMELRGRTEVGFFIAMEIALVAKKRGYIQSFDWFLDWVSKLTLGEGTAGAAIAQRGPAYASSEMENRFDNFAGILAAALPHKPGSFNWIATQIPMLYAASCVTAAMAFNDREGIQLYDSMQAHFMEMVQPKFTQKQTSSHQSGQTTPQTSTGCLALIGLAIILGAIGYSM